MRLLPLGCAFVLLPSLHSPIYAASAQSRPEITLAPLARVALMNGATASDLPAILRAAEGGDVVAQRTMGDAARLGIGGRIDTQVSAAWFRRAAEAGDDYSAGHLYGTEGKQAESRAAYRRAAERGDAAAQAALGASYFGASGGPPAPPDYAQSFVWFTRAAEQGYFEGLFGLGGLYATGLGVRRDVVEAHKLMNLGLILGGTMRIHAKDYMQEAFDSLTRTMTDSQVREARKRAGEWLRAHVPPASAK